MQNDDSSIKNVKLSDSHQTALNDEYLSDIENHLSNKPRFIQGMSDSWILKNVSLKNGCEIGLSPSNNCIYLTLSLENGDNKLTLKMGGAFTKHIEIVKQQAENLINCEVIWHTWNDSTTNWSEDSWFYKIDKKLPIV